MFKWVAGCCVFVELKKNCSKILKVTLWYNCSGFVCCEYIKGHQLIQIPWYDQY